MLPRPTLVVVSLLTRRARRDAWNKRKDLTEFEAKRIYVDSLINVSLRITSYTSCTQRLCLGRFSRASRIVLSPLLIFENWRISPSTRVLEVAQVSNHLQWPHVRMLTF